MTLYRREQAGELISAATEMFIDKNVSVDTVPFWVCFELEFLAVLMKIFCDLSCTNDGVMWNKQLLPTVTLL